MICSNLSNLSNIVDDSKSLISSKSRMKEVLENRLKSIERYTLDDLKIIAKNFSLPIFTKEDNKRKNYKKEELYNIIKNYMDKKKSV